MNYVYKKKFYKTVFAAIDGVGTFFFEITRLFTRKPVLKIKNILVVRVDHIGDVVMATAALTPLRTAFPDSRIDFMAPSWAGELLSSDPRVDNVVIFGPPWFDRKRTGFWGGLRGFTAMMRIMRKGGYDVVVDLRGDARHILASFLSGIRCRISYGITGLGFLLTHKVLYEERSHEVDRNMALLEPLGVKNEKAEVRLNFCEDSVLEVKNIIEKENIMGPYAVFHVTAGRKEKNWTMEGFAGVIDRIAADRGILPVMIGTREDSVYIEGVIAKISHKVINLTGRLGLGALGVFIGGASLFVGLDSGPSHIAAATGVPCVILFSGVNDPSQWAPRGGNVKVIFPGNGKQLAEISVDEVISELDQVAGKGS